jgi:hypothetical protein
MWNSSEPKDSSSIASGAKAHFAPPLRPTDPTRKTPVKADPDAQADRIARKSADGMTKIFRENPDYEVPY